MRSIDCSMGEGGGQIIRSSLSLSALLGESVSLENIRANRPNPGLQAQHLTCVKALQEITRARTEGAVKKSSKLSFEPGPPKPGNYSFDVGTAGSVSLVFQALLLPLAFAGGPSSVKIRGGTHVAWSPPATYLEKVFLPFLQRFGVNAGLETKRFGWYPEGGGEITATTGPCKALKPVNLVERGELVRVQGHSFSSNLPEHVAKRQKTAALKVLVERGVEASLECVDSPAPGKGSCVFLLAEFEHSLAGFSSLGERGKPAEKVGAEAALQLLEFLDSRACVDEHLADQLVLPAALASGETVLRCRASRHLLTNLGVAKAFLPIEFEAGEQGGECDVVIRGCKPNSF